MGYTFRNSDLLLGRYSGSFFKEQIISPNSGSIILFDKNLNPNVVTTSSLFFSKLSASRLYVDKSASINNLRVTGPTTLIGQLTASSTRINGNVNVIGSVKAVSFTGSFSGSINSSNVNGTTNYIPKFTSANSIGNSVIYQNGNNIGIGTTSPLQKLSVVSGSALLASNALAGELYFGTDGSNIYLKRDNSYDLSLVQNGDSNSKLYLASAGNVYVSIDSNNNDTDKAFIVQNNAIKAGTELFRVQENGNVGIGTTSPGARLEVSGSSKNILLNLRSPSSANILYVSGSGNVGIGTTNPLAKLDVRSQVMIGDASIAGVAYQTLSVGGDVRIHGTNRLSFGNANGGYANIGITGTSTGTITFNTWDGSADQERLRIVNTTGNIGIGTTNPTGRLEVSGSSNASILKLYRNAASATTPLFYAVEANGSPGKANVGLFERLNNLTAANVSASSAGVRIREHSSNYALSVEDHSGNSLLVVKGNGSVGIGTNTPSGKLDVNGNVIATSFTGSFSGSNARFSKLTGSGVRITGPTVVVGNTTIGDASSDTLTVVARSNFTGPLSASNSRYNGDVVIGASGANVLKITSTTYINNQLTASATRLTSTLDVVGTADFFGNVSVGDASSDTLTVNATSTFNNPITASSARYTGNVVIGDASSDTLKVNATTTFFGPLSSSNLRTNGRLHVSSSASGAAFIVSTANQGGTNDTNAAFIVTGSRVGIMTDDVDYTLEVNGSFAATTKSFVINYKNKPGSKLVHASLEGPEHGVYYRGNTTSSRVNLPEYWNWLVKEDNINIIITPNKRYQELYVENIVLNEVECFFTVKERGIKGWFNRKLKKPLNYSYLVNAERKDVPPLEVELKKRRHRK